MKKWYSVVLSHKDYGKFRVAIKGKYEFSSNGYYDQIHVSLNLTEQQALEVADILDTL